MKKLSSILHRVRKEQLVIVFLMICLVFSQQAMSLQIEEQGKREKAEGNDDEDSTEAFVLDSFSMLTPAVQTHINHVFYKIMDIEYDTVKDHFKEFPSKIDPESYLKILFRRVISPNAP